MKENRAHRTGPARRWLFALLCALTFESPAAADGFLQLRNGYFWDPATEEYFIPRGVAYQTFNPPVGANQTFDQLDYDLVEFKKMYVNSVRVEMVWNEVQPTENTFDWSKPDYLVARAGALGLKLFVLIGFQYAPNWFTNHPDWKATNDIGGGSVVLNYEHPQARKAYSNYITQVASRYKNSAAIGAWILGNEYAYFDLWNPDRRYLGYDPFSKTNFQNFLSSMYHGSIAALNTVWATAYPGFSAVVMPRQYPPNRNNPAYNDLTLWREHSIGDYVAIGAAAAKSADPNHLRTYSMIGGIYSDYDANYTCEDAKTIVARCAAASAPLDFWSINNYAWATLYADLRSADFGIAKHQAQSGLPVMISETGHSTTVADLPGAPERQAKALPGQMWEALISGAIGAHFFTWNDRDLFAGSEAREKGFGIVSQKRLPKPNGVYTNMLEMFRRMENIKINHLLAGSSNPPPDIQYFWSKSSEMGWPSANAENAMIWGALKRLGYQPGIIDDDQFEQGAYTNAPALLLSRSYQMNPAHLDRIATNAIPAGIHVHANADLPGQFNAYHKPNTNWIARMNSIFGLNVTNSAPAWDSGVTNTEYHRVYLTAANSLGVLKPGYATNLNTWKIWRGLGAVSGTTIVTHTGDSNSAPAMPALQIKDLGSAKSAINTFALGHTLNEDGFPTHELDVRYDWLRAIYRSHFGMMPRLDLVGPGASYVIPDYRICQNGSILVSLLNGHTNSASITLTASNLLAGKTVENLTSGGILETKSDGVVTVDLLGDDYVLLYAYPSVNGVDQSLTSSSPQKIWFVSAPNAIWPNGIGTDVALGYDTQGASVNLRVSFDRVTDTNRIYAQSAAVSVIGQGTNALHLSIPDADPNDSSYLSSRDGGNYIFHAWLEQNGIRLSEVVLPVRLLWGVHPLASLPAVIPGNTYQITLAWQELPAYEPSEIPTPLSRADLWDPLLAEFQFYDIVLELQSNGQTVGTDHFLTSTATDSHPFSITVPPSATGPFTWLAYLRPSPKASHDVIDGFEERDTGAYYDASNQVLQAVSPIFPWVSGHYPANVPNEPVWYNEGVAPNSDGSQSMFLIVSNPPPPLGFSGFYVKYTFPQSWALPSNSNLWTNFTFSCDFRESHTQACVLELQVQDDLGGQISFTKQYRPGPTGWDTVSASLNQFLVTPYAPFTGYFNQARVHAIVVNIQMQQSNVVYNAAFDNIRFDGPEQASPAFTSRDVFDSFEDRAQGTTNTTLSPWTPYHYAEHTNTMLLSAGIQPLASDGFRSAFLLVQNPADPGGFSGFGMYYDFASPWALPATTNNWTNYVFAFDFKESSGFPCVLEVQVKSAADHWISFFKNYVGSNQWDTIRASLDQFRVPPGSLGFDPTQVQTIVVNIQMLEKNVLYFGSFDNIRFQTPHVPDPPDLRYASDSSANDSLLDTDHDGIPDIYETGTGVYVSPTNTGTNPNNPDTDGDGLPDGAELIAGTNPNLASDVFRISGIRRDASGQTILSWLAHTNRVYAIHYWDGDLMPGGCYLPLSSLTNLTATANGVLEAVDATAPPSGRRFYRLTVRLP